MKNKYFIEPKKKMSKKVIDICKYFIYDSLNLIRDKKITFRLVLERQNSEGILLQNHTFGINSLSNFLINVNIENKKNKTVYREFAKRIPKRGILFFCLVLKDN